MGVMPHLFVLGCLEVTCDSYLQYFGFYGDGWETEALCYENFKGTWSMKIYCEGFDYFRWKLLPSEEIGILGIYEESFHGRWLWRRGSALWRISRILLHPCFTWANVQLNHQIHLLKVNHASRNCKTLQLSTLRLIWVNTAWKENCWKAYVLSKHA